MLQRDTVRSAGLSREATAVSGQDNVVVVAQFDPGAGGPLDAGVGRAGKLEDVASTRSGMVRPAVLAMSAMGTWKVRQPPGGGAVCACPFGVRRGCAAPGVSGPAGMLDAASRWSPSHPAIL